MSGNGKQIFLSKYKKDILMKKEDLNTIKESIMMCKIRLRNMQPYIKTSEKISQSYNKVLIEKAILREKALHKEPTLMEKLVRKVTPRKKKLICDYFKSAV